MISWLLIIGSNKLISGYIKEPLNKSIQDLSEDANKKFDFLFARIFNDLMSMKMTALPCAAGSSDLIRASSNLFAPKLLLSLDCIGTAILT